MTFNNIDCLYQEIMFDLNNSSSTLKFNLDISNLKEYILFSPFNLITLIFIMDSESGFIINLNYIFSLSRFLYLREQMPF